MHMRLGRVVMIGGNPVEMDSEILFDLRHELLREPGEILHLLGVFRRDDQTELPAVIRSPFIERFPVGFLTASVIEFSALTITAGPISPDIGDMLSKARRTGRPRPRDMHLHDNPSGALVRPVPGKCGLRLAAPLVAQGAWLQGFAAFAPKPALARDPFQALQLDLRFALRPDPSKLRDEVEIVTQGSDRAGGPKSMHAPSGPVSHGKRCADNGLGVPVGQPLNLALRDTEAIPVPLSIALTVA